MKRYDMIVIGAGSAGLVAATTAQRLGARTALVEHRKIGGECLHSGCVPSKALVHAARVYHEMLHADRLGLPRVTSPVQFSQVMEHVGAVVESIYEHENPEVFRRMGIDVYEAAASFESPDTVRVGDEIWVSSVPWSARDQVRSSRLSRILRYALPDERERLGDPRSSPIDPLRRCRPDLRGVGAGTDPIRARVTLVEMLDRVLPNEDEDTSDTIRTLLERAGVRHSPRGIETDAQLRTSAPRSYACGDVVGPLRFTHTAGYQADVAIRNALSNGAASQDLSVIPWVTISDPECARVGLTEREARAAHGQVQVLRVGLDRVDRPRTEGRTEGFLKVVLDASDRIVGAHAVAPHAGEFIHELALAMRHGLGIGAIASTIHAYPTYAELVRKRPSATCAPASRRAEHDRDLGHRPDARRGVRD